MLLRGRLLSWKNHLSNNRISWVLESVTLYFVTCNYTEGLTMRIITIKFDQIM